MENWNGGKGWSNDSRWFGWKESPFIILRREEKQFVRIELASNSMPTFNRRHYCGVLIHDYVETMCEV